MCSISHFLWLVIIGSCRPVANRDNPKLVLLQKLASDEVYSECCTSYFSTTFHFWIYCTKHRMICGITTVLLLLVSTIKCLSDGLSAACNNLGFLWLHSWRVKQTFYCPFSRLWKANFILYTFITVGSSFFFFCKFNQSANFLLVIFT